MRFDRKTFLRLRNDEDTVMKSIGKKIVIPLLFCYVALAFSETVFRSPEEATEFAVSNSKEYRLKKLYVEASYKAARIALQEFLPSFNASWSENDAVKIGGTDSHSKSLQFSARQVVGDGGKRIVAYKMNKTDAYYAVKTYEQELQAFQSSVINQYCLCLRQQEIIKIKNDLEKNAATQLEIIKEEYRLGIALENDYLEYLISFRKIQNDKKRAERELRTQMRVLKSIIDMAADEELRLENALTGGADIPYLEPHIAELWHMTDERNPAIKKAEAALHYAEQRYKYTKLFFLPEVAVEGGVSFSGTAYPLNKPSYSLKLSLNFQNVPFVPTTIGNGYGFNKKQLVGLDNSLSAGIVPDTNYFIKHNIGKIALEREGEQLRLQKNAVHEQLFEKAAAYDDGKDSIERISESILLREKRLAVSAEQVEKGEMKRVDYLAELMELAEEKINRIAAETAVRAALRDIEIVLCVPFGGLQKCF